MTLGLAPEKHPYWDKLNQYEKDSVKDLAANIVRTMHYAEAAVYEDAIAFSMVSLVEDVHSFREINGGDVAKND